MGLWEELASALAGAVTDDEVLTVIADVAAPALGAQSVNISMLTDDELTLQLVTSRHTRPEVKEKFATYSARAPLPSTHALLTGRPVLLRDVAERDRRYPLLAGVPVEQEAFAVLPLLDPDGGHPLGILGLGWADRQPFSADQVAVLARVAQVCALALARSRVHMRERHARARAERTAARLAGVYALTTRLAAAVKADQVGAVLLDVGVPALGATAAMVIAYDGTAPARLLAARGVPESAARVLPGFERLPLVQDLIARGPVLVTSFADRAARYPGMVDIGVRQQAWANLPLRVDDQLVGIAAFGWDMPRVFTDADREFLSSLATHTAIALDRARLLEAAQTATDTVQALQDVTAALATAATSEQIAAVLIDRGIGLVADHGVVAYVDDQAQCLRTRCTPSIPSDIARRLARIEFDQATTTPVSHAATSGQTLALTSFEDIITRYPNMFVGASHQVTGTGSLLVVPVRAAGRPVAALAFGFSTPGPAPAPVASIAGTLADLAGQALERARLYEVEHRIAHQLQQALLPRIDPDLPGVTAGVCYRPAEARHEVGGDWYDVFALPGGRVGFAVGDVVGHDLKAATVMGQLQTLLRSVAVSGAGPAEVLESLDEACERIAGARASSVGYAEYTPAQGRLLYACAGHLPPLLISGGSAAFLWEGRSPLLGLRTSPRAQAEVAVTRNALLVWYTDGLIERRGEDLDHGMNRLASCVAAFPAPTDPAWPGVQSWTDRLLTDMIRGESMADDVVIAALHLRGTPEDRA